MSDCETGITRMRSSNGHLDMCLRVTPGPDLQPILDTLGYDGPLELDDEGLVEGGLDAFEDHCAALLHDVRPETTARLMARDGAFPRIADTLVPTAFAGLLSALGINPVAVAALGRLGVQEFDLESGSLDGHIVTVDPDGLLEGRAMLIATVHKPRAITWEATWNEITAHGDVPETVIPCLAGRELRQVVSTPLADLIDARIDHATTTGLGLRLVLEGGPARDVKPLAETASSVLKHR